MHHFELNEEHQSEAQTLGRVQRGPEELMIIMHMLIEEAGLKTPQSLRLKPAVCIFRRAAGKSVDKFEKLLLLFRLLCGFSKSGSLCQGFMPLIYTLNGCQNGIRVIAIIKRPSFESE